jgi:hypothetical protein
MLGSLIPTGRRDIMSEEKNLLLLLLLSAFFLHV